MLSPSARRRVAALVPPALALAALVAAARRSVPGGGDGDAVAAGLALGLLAALGALHRPFGGRTLGLGAATLAPAIVLAGPVAAGAAAAIGILLAEGGRALLSRRVDLPRPGVALPRALGAAGRSALAVLAGAAAWISAGGAIAGGAGAPAAGVLVPATAAVAIYLLVGLALAVAMREVRTPSTGLGAWRAAPRRREAMPWVVDLGGWTAGGALAAAAPAAGWTESTVLLAVIGLAGAEAARQAMLRAVAERRLADFGRVRRAGERMIAPAPELEAVVHRILDECANVVGCHWFQLELVQPAGPIPGDEERTVWSAGPDRLLAEGAARPDPHPPALPGVHRRAEWRRLERPLGAQGGAWARLTLWCDPRRLSPEDLELLDALLPQMAASLHQALLDRAASEDTLTGTALRRVFDRRLHAAWAEACESGGSLAAILVDVDRFKGINDTFGHAIGDRALSAVAAALAAGKRDSDLLARYGGEEFAVLLEATDGAGALAIAERLRVRVSEIELETEEGRRLALTISAGVASFPELTVKTAGELLLLADDALYQAKAVGRDRCLLYLGRGRYLTADGAEVGDGPPAGGEPRAPRLFA